MSLGDPELTNSPRGTYPTPCDAIHHTTAVTRADGDGATLQNNGYLFVAHAAEHHPVVSGLALALDGAAQSKGSRRSMSAGSPRLWPSEFARVGTRVAAASREDRWIGSDKSTRTA